MMLSTFEPNSMNAHEKNQHNEPVAPLELIVAALLAALIMVLAIPLMTKSTGAAQHHQPQNKPAVAQSDHPSE